MNELVIKHASKLESKLYKLYTLSGGNNWFRFVRSLDPTIVSVHMYNWDTHIAFEGEEYRNWFILKWT
jgi:hypothetical protein